MAAASVRPAPHVNSPGLLLTHDWTQIHTPRALIDVTIDEADPSVSSCYHTEIFQITNEFQFATFVNNIGRCNINTYKNCPLQLVPQYDFEQSGGCYDKSLSAMVKMVYKVTHTLSNTQGDTSLSQGVIRELQDIESKTLESEVPKSDIVQLLTKYGSHFPRGIQRLGKCFSWMVVVDEQCNMDLLREISEEIFDTCEKYQENIPGSHEGIWYTLRNVLNCASWSEEKKKLYQSARLRVCHQGNDTNQMSFNEWKQNDFVDRPVKVDATSGNIVSIWDLTEQSPNYFNLNTSLSSLIKDEWKQLSAETQHLSPPPVELNNINLPHIRWSNVLDDLGMKDYFPAKVTLQNVRSINVQREEQVSKNILPWNVLNQLILLNVKGREDDISKFAKKIKATKESFQDRIKRGKGKKPADKAEAVPHPMDVTLLAYLCSDFMLRQVLAKKLFMCCLAIPFIVPTLEDSVEILLWPLRSIVMEWRNQHGAQRKPLVTSHVNMVAFMRLGHTQLSKSKLLNTILSSSSHDIFCHKDTPCGNGKRQICNGTVEMSHYLPSASQNDHFSEPALFFNLRGDACDYPVQHSLLMELATVLVILVDLQKLQTKTLQDMLCKTLKTKNKIVVILTDSKGHSDEELEKLIEMFCCLLGDALPTVAIVNTFEDGKERNSTEMIQEIRESITGKMVQNPPHSLEEFSASTKCTVDEFANQHCKTGKMVADKILSRRINEGTMKQHLLPQQGKDLHETGKLLRELHRSSGKETSRREKEDIKKNLQEIKNKLADTSKGNTFMHEVISMFHEPTDIKTFAMRWIQMNLDAISLDALALLTNKKNKKWHEKVHAHSHKMDSVSILQQEIDSLEEQIDDATFGMEHIMREMAQLYDVAADLGQLESNSTNDLSSLPDSVAQMLLEGQPIELMDGDHGFIPLAWLKAVFRSLDRLVGEKKLFVVSVMGIQSSGKSTLLNTLFGLEFPVSAGRCTRGIYAQLLPVAGRSGYPVDYMLVLDSEGLRALEGGHHNCEHDNELATLVVGLSDLALINMKGENVMEITEILEIVVLAFLRMQLADSTQRNRCMFIHHNVSAVNAEEDLAKERQKFQERLNKMTKQAAESQGLHQTITSFNDVIGFGGEQDIVYFSDLWHGDPPMAPVNQGYSTRAAKTRQRILTKVSQKCKTLLTIPQFVIRINDMWNGVLTDDFVFNFRNSLAAKAYLVLEREFTKLTMEMEDDLLQWVNTTCSNQIHNCLTEPDVDTKCTDLRNSLHERVSNQKAEKDKYLADFFASHPSRDIIVQWQEEKKTSFRLFTENVMMRMDMKLSKMKHRWCVDVQQRFHDKEQAVMTQAINLADKLRGKCPKEALEEKFEEIWDPWAAEIIAVCFQNPLDVNSVLMDVLWDAMAKEGAGKFLDSEIKHTSAAQDTSREEITFNILTTDQIFVKPGNALHKTNDSMALAIQTFFVTTDQINAMQTAVMAKVDNISQEDMMFDEHHGRQVITFALDSVTNFNGQEHIPFSFTQQFRAKFALRIVRYATRRFDEMNKRYEEKHGIRTKLKHLRERVFKQFQNAVQDATTEVIVSDDFCEAIREPLKDYVRLQIDQHVVQDLHHKLGTTKYELITNMLDVIAEEQSFLDLCSYVHDPVTYASDWIKTFGRKLIFGDNIAQSKYKQHVQTIVGKIISTVKQSTEAATHSMKELKSSQYSTWLGQFRDDMGETVPFNARQMDAQCTDIKDFEHFQKCLEKNLKDLEVSLNQELWHATPETITWANEVNPFQRVYKRLWGCWETCPLCKEPCQHSDKNHKTSHSCIQHRPAGMRGTKDKESCLLVTGTCNMNVASACTIFNCDACSFECRKTKHDTEGDEKVCHRYREYKKFLPKWDIAPDPSGEASKFWKWAMCTFQDELVEKYRKANDVAGVEIPESWKGITQQQARDSLREFFQ